MPSNFFLKKLFYNLFLLFLICEKFNKFAIINVVKKIVN
jgi:hypothetical protein